jgi:hypothetical protein
VKYNGSLEDYNDKGSEGYWVSVKRRRLKGCFSLDLEGILEFSFSRTRYMF